MSEYFLQEFEIKPVSQRLLKSFVHVDMASVGVCRVRSLEVYDWLEQGALAPKQSVVFA